MPVEGGFVKKRKIFDPSRSLFNFIRGNIFISITPPGYCFRILGKSRMNHPTLASLAMDYDWVGEPATIIKSHQWLTDFLQ